MKQTTLSINPDALILVNELAFLLGRSKSEIIILACTTFKNRNIDKISQIKDLMGSFL